MTHDEHYMQRCIELALLGRGYVSPNPLVGCVIVHNGNIIGEGWHKQYGGAHAEVNAIVSVQNKELLSQSTVYVNLEPCNHFGKTPPCADLLVKYVVKRVVVGMVDPFAKVSGTGIQKLKGAGIDVVVGVLEDECKELNKRFITFHTNQRPYIILKWAQTQDGFLSPDSTQMTAVEFEEKRHITGLTIQVLVHKWRGQEDAIMVGTRTAILDNPALNTRAFPGREPIRITIDRNGKIPRNHKLFDGTQRTIVFTDSVNEEANNISFVALNIEQDLWPQILSYLYKTNIQSIIVEGGAETLNRIIQSGIWDEAQIFTAPVLMKNGVVAPAISGALQLSTIIDSVQLNIYRNL